MQQQTTNPLTNQLPIDMELVKKRAYLPVKLSQLAKKDTAAALDLLNAWGEGTKAVTTLWEEVTQALEH